MSSDALPTALPGKAAEIYVVAGGNHVVVLLDRAVTDGHFDVIEVIAQPGGGPPPHRHAFAEWFRVLEGELTICEERAGTMVCTRVLQADDAIFIPGGVFHATRNESPATCRFQVVGQPGQMSAYFAEAGIRVATPLDAAPHPPPGPAQLGEIARRWGIEFWTGPADYTPPT